MRVSQRGTTMVCPASGCYVLDRSLVYSYPGNIITGNQLTLTSIDTPFSAGFTHAFQAIVTTANGAGIAFMEQIIEGNNISDFMWGSKSGVPIVVSLWIKTNMATGSLSSIVIKSGLSWSYCAQYTVANSGAWQYVKVSVPQPPTGSSWGTGTSSGIRVCWGASWPGNTISPNTWGATNTYTPTGESETFYATLGNYFTVTGIQLEKGTLATPFEFRPFAVELQLCQRYYQQFKVTSTNTPVQLGWCMAGSTKHALGSIVMQGNMRTSTPNLISSSAGSTAYSSGHAVSQTDLLLFNALTSTGIAMANFYGFNCAQNNVLPIQFADNEDKLTAGQMYYIYVTNGGSFALSAEL